LERTHSCTPQHPIEAGQEARISSITASSYGVNDTFERDLPDHVSSRAQGWWRTPGRFGERHRPKRSGAIGD